jgi:hypothetical protein
MLSFLLVGAVMHDVHRGKGRDGDGSGEIKAELCQAFAEQGIGEDVGAVAAMILRDQQSQPTLIGNFLIAFIGIFTFLIAVPDVLAADLLFHEAIDGVAPNLLFFA